LTAGVSGEVFENIRLVGDVVPGLMDACYGHVPPKFKKKSYTETVSRLLKTGNIRKIVNKKGNVSLELSQSGANKLKRNFPIFSKGRWDGNFMIVIFDIPEERKRERDDLREKLKELGFGKLQESVWISPYHFEDDLKEFLQETGYINDIYVLKATKLLGNSIKANAKYIWNLGEINQKYSEVLAGVQKIISKKIDPGKAGGVWNLYFETLATDPLLPKELLPSNWKQPEAKIMLDKLYMLIKSKRPLDLNQ